MRFFNTEGPVNCQYHYCLPPLDRIGLDELLTLIERQKYFLLHAPRQTGKTTYLLALTEYLNQGGRYQAVYANLEDVQAAREDVEAGMKAAVQLIARRAAQYFPDSEAEQLAQAVLRQQSGYVALGAFLTAWCKRSPKPVVLLLDEVDSLIGDTLISLLRQLRSGYDTRPALFPQSVMLCGVRDIQDYRIHSSIEKAIITGGSAFNIKAKSLRLGDFNQEEIFLLLGQHEQETGQPFTPEALALIWQFTNGQPWLVNALAYEACFEMQVGRIRTQPITAELIQEAKERLILRRVTHLHQLSDKLKEPRVRRVIEPMLRGDELTPDISEDDVQYTLDLGLVRRGPNGLEVANRIYAEVIPRELTVVQQIKLETIERPAWYIEADGQLNMPKLLAAFQQFFRENSEFWLERYEYREAGPHLLLQAFLQRIVNGGGRVDREYGLGRRRTDLLVIWPHAGGVQRVVIEIKLLRKAPDAILRKSLAQTADYADKVGATDAHLLLFDIRPNRPWDERIFHRQESHQGRTITVWGM
ncbi:MAG: AAA-like domain-containing protein [Anaerolineae bacterium]